MRLKSLWIVGFLALPALAETVDDGSLQERDMVRLYQVGQNGKYCVSLSRDTSRCISGVEDNGEPINVLDVLKGKTVVFENLSDAPHDMRITGVNGENMPAQDPGAAPAAKQMVLEDFNPEMINCSYHGDQLGFGYRVPEDPQAGLIDDFEGHNNAGKEAEEGSPQVAEEREPAKPIVATRLADVSNEVISRGAQKEVEKLIEGRPDLMKDLVKSRPELANQLAEKGIGVPKPGPLVAEDARNSNSTLGSRPLLSQNGNDRFFDEKSGGGKASVKGSSSGGGKFAKSSAGNIGKGALANAGSAAASSTAGSSSRFAGGKRTGGLARAEDTYDPGDRKKRGKRGLASNRTGSTFNGKGGGRNGNGSNQGEGEEGALRNKDKLRTYSLNDRAEGKTIPDFDFSSWKNRLASGSQWMKWALALLGLGFILTATGLIPIPFFFRRKKKDGVGQAAADKKDGLVAPVGRRKRSVKDSDRARHRSADLSRKRTKKLSAAQARVSLKPHSRKKTKVS